MRCRCSSFVRQLPAELRLVAEAALDADGELAEAQRATGLSTSEFYRRLREIRYRMFMVGLVDRRTFDLLGKSQRPARYLTATKRSRAQMTSLGKTALSHRYLTNNRLIGPLPVIATSTSIPAGTAFRLHEKGLPMFPPPEASRPQSKKFIPFDENDFVDWIVDAKANDCIAYYRGHLGRDRHPSSAILSSLRLPQAVGSARRGDDRSRSGLGVFPSRSVSARTTTSTSRCVPSVGLAVRSRKCRRPRWRPDGPNP